MSSRTPRLLLCLLAAATLPVASGCILVGAVAGKVMPEPKIPAAYDLGERPTAIDVRADERVLGELGLMEVDPVLGSLRRQLEERTKARLIRGGALNVAGGQTIVVDLMPGTETQTIGSDFTAGAASARVRVFDQKGDEVWPADGGAGQVVTGSVPPATSGSPQEIRREALRDLGRRVALLFHPHTETEVLRPL